MARQSSTTKHTRSILFYWILYHFSRRTCENRDPMDQGSFYFIRKWLQDVEEECSTRIVNGPGTLLSLRLSSLPAMTSLLTRQIDNMLFSPRSPFARLSEAPGAQIFGRSFRTPQQSPEPSHPKASLSEVLNLRQEAHGYKRRPRRKSKDDRYEYKGHDRRAVPERSKKEKTTKQSQKRTLIVTFMHPTCLRHV